MNLYSCIFLVVFKLYHDARIRERQMDWTKWAGIY